LLLIFFIFC